jgi:ABC transporter substrate binding protein
VAVLVAGGGVHGALAAKTATTTIPIVFVNESDPVKFGLVASLSRPAGNITGVNFFTAELEAKRLGLLRELVGVDTLAVLANSTNANFENQSKELKEAARALGVALHMLNASDEREIEKAFGAIAQTGARALLVASDPYFYSQREKLVAHHAQDDQAARDALRAADPSSGADHQPLQLPSPGRLGRASAGTAGEACTIPSTAADGAARADGPDVEGSSESRTQVETTNTRVSNQAHSALRGRKRGLARGRPRRRPTTR